MNKQHRASADPAIRVYELVEVSSSGTEEQITVGEYAGLLWLGSLTHPKDRYGRIELRPLREKSW